MKYVYVEDDIAENLEAFNTVSKTFKEDIKTIINRLNMENDSFVESLNDNSIRFKLFAKDIAKGYKEAVEQEIESLNEVWESLDDKRAEVYKKTKEINKLCLETRDYISTLQTSISNLNVYGVDKVIDLVNKFNNMSEKEKELLMKLIEVSK